MPIVNGKYEAKISTTFRSGTEGIKAIRDKIRKSRKVRISNVPVKVLKELAPLLEGKDVKIILPEKQEPTPELTRLGDVAVTNARIYKDHKGTDANLGSIYFSDRTFSIAWADDKILQMDAMDYDKCVKCMKSMFDIGWRYARK